MEFPMRWEWSEIVSLKVRHLYRSGDIGYQTIFPSRFWNSKQ